MVADLRDTATELFSIPLAVENIQSRYFDGGSILLTDVRESLELQMVYARYFLNGTDAAEQPGSSELVTDSHEFRNVIGDKASKKALYISALARSEMLERFGRPEAANEVLRPFILDGPAS